MCPSNHSPNQRRVYIFKNLLLSREGADFFGEEEEYT